MKNINLMALIILNADNDILDKFYDNDYNIEDVIEEDEELEL